MAFYSHGTKDNHNLIHLLNSLVKTSGRQITIELGNPYYIFEMLSDAILTF